MKLSWKYVALFLVLYGNIVSAQVATGAYPYGTFDNPGPDTINVGNLNLHLEIPFLHKAGRGLPFTYDLSFDNSIWYPVTVNGTTSWTPVQSFGWRGITEIATGYVSYSFDMTTEDGCTITRYTDFVYHDPFGVSHPFGAETQRGKGTDCPSISSDSAEATDGSGLTLNVTNYTTTSIQTPRGKSIAVPATSNGAATATDSNGNQISVDGSGHFTDTTGNVVLTVAGTPSGSSWTQTYTYTDTNGHPQEVKVNYTKETVATDFGCTSAGISEFPATAEYLVSSVVLGDGTSTYAFSYERLSSGYYTGRLSTVTLPQGGVITYTYPGANDGINCSDGSTQELKRQLSANAGSAASTWTYTRTQPNGTGTSHTEVVDGISNYKEYDFVLPATSTSYTFAPGTYYETNRQIYQGAKSGTPYLAQSTCYNANTSSCLTTLPSPPLSQVDTYATFNGTETDGITSKYDTYGELTESDAYDFGSSGSRGSLLRKEVWAYGYSIAGLPTSDIVYDGSGNIAAETTYAYDQTTPTASSGVPQHESVTGPRGNLTTQTVYASSGTSYATTDTYEDTGSLLTSKLTAGSYSGTTTYSYDSTFVYLENEQLPTPSSGIAISYGATYDTSYTGLPLSSTDPNSQTSHITSYDEMLRPLTATYPDGGKTTWVYSPTSTSADLYQSSSVYTTSELQYDAYGRSSRSLLSNGQSSDPYYEQDSCYDANGNTSFLSYRYQGTGASGSNCTTSGDTSTYDVLGRITKVTHADNTTQAWTYSGRATQFTDENGVSRITQVDGLGRPSIVCEIYSGSALTGSGSPASCGTDISGTGYVSSYAYALATGTTTVTQGAQTRTFQSDWLGRPTETIEPESGTTTYGYAYNSTGLVVTRTRPKANQTGTSTTTTTTQYDSLGRPVSITYSDGTPTKSFAYDAASEWGHALQYPKGRLAEFQTGTGPTTGSILSYDAMGRVIFDGECTPSTCGTSGFNVSATYDWEGNTATFTDAFGPTYTYGYTVANEQKSVTSNWDDSNHPPNLLSSATFGPDGPTSWMLGNGLTGVQSYDSLGRVQGGWVCSGSSETYCTGGTQLHGFSESWSGANISASCDTSMNQCFGYGYDNFNRLASRTTTEGTVQNFSYAYDRWGNRWSQTVTSGSGPQPQLSFDTANNQVSTSGYTYDKAGNMTDDGVHSYTYDAEGNVTQVDGGETATYTYDALNRRVRIDNGPNGSSGGSFEFIFDPHGRHSSDYYVQGAYEDEGWAYWGNSRLSFYFDSTTTFEHQDWLGTERARTNVSGAVAGTYVSLPFGDGYSASGEDWDAYHFAGLDQDNTANEHAQYREYSNMAGRWFSPDPYQGSYDPANPQSFDRYAYVGNNPLSLNDTPGLCVTPGVIFCINGWGTPLGPSGSGGPSGSQPGIPLIRRGPIGGGGAPNNGNNCSVLDTNCKKMGPVATYLTFLQCENLSIMETITDEEDGVGPTAYGFINAGALAAIKYKQGNLIGLTFVATASIMDLGAVAKANSVCTQAIYGH